MDAAHSALLVLEGLGAFLAFATALRAAKAYKLVRAPSVRRLAYGFNLLAMAQVAAVMLTLTLTSAGDSIDRTRFDFFDAYVWLHYVALLAGLVFVFASFGRHPFRWAPALPLLLTVGPILQFAVILVLFFVVLHAGLNHIAQMRGGSSRVAIGFFFVFAGHVVNLVGYSAVEPRWWPGEALNVIGLVILFTSVAKPRSIPNG